MDRADPCGCRSPWVQRVNRYLAQNRALTDSRPQVATLQFLLSRGHCGIHRTARIGEILVYLDSSGLHYDREEFQQQVLTDLKRQGLVASLVYPGRRGGIFIPCDNQEVHEVTVQVSRRVLSELRNAEGSAMGSPDETGIRDLRRRAEAFDNSLR